MEKTVISDLRSFLKDDIRQRDAALETDQSLGVPVPPLQKAVPVGASLTALPKPETCGGNVDLRIAIGTRRSRRRFGNAVMTLADLSFLLWATQGVTRVFGDRAAFRTVPSAGARHAFETYLCVNRVESLASGVYRYLPFSHELCLVSRAENLSNVLSDAVLGQAVAGISAVTFVWAAIPYRMEWRYGAAAYKIIALDAGHVCQNLYLACAAIGAGACAIAAYDQKAMDRLICVDGENEFTVYLAAAGKV